MSKEGWLKLSESEKEYHKRQFRETYRSTIALVDWIESLGCINSHNVFRIADVGAGGGANLYYLAKKFPKSNFMGIELNPELVALGNQCFERFGQSNCRLVEADLYDLDESYVRKFDGIVSFQTLSWLPEFRTPLLRMIRLKPKWIAITSLFFDGDINCIVKVQDYTKTTKKKRYKEAYYNIYSLRLIREIFEANGYLEFRCIPFEIDLDLPKPKTKGMGTYTLRLENGHHIQKSGPLLMPWYFVCGKRKD